MLLAKVVVFLLCASPFLFYAGEFVVYGFEEIFQRYADPVQEVEHQSGAWALRFLLLTLAVTPVRIMTGWTQVLRFRRMLGLFAFFYALVHFLVYLLMDLQLDFGEVFEDILERPYITVGFSALLLMIPLALTSTRGMMRKLGRRWQKLHRLVYVVAILAVLHFIWLIKLDLREPLIHAAILVALFAIRFRARWRKQQSPG